MTGRGKGFDLDIKLNMGAACPRHPKSALHLQLPCVLDHYIPATSFAQTSLQTIYQASETMLWLMIMFMFFIVSSVLSEDYQEPPFISEISQCLLRSRFLHPPSGRCLEPLERGPCADNQWLVPSKLNKTLLECQEKPETRGTLLALLLIEVEILDL